MSTLDDARPDGARSQAPSQPHMKPEQLAMVHAAMMEELGWDRLKGLPMEHQKGDAEPVDFDRLNRLRHGNPMAWNTKIFDDVAAEDENLDPMNRGQTHRNRLQRELAAARATRGRPANRGGHGIGHASGQGQFGSRNVVQDRPDPKAVMNHLEGGRDRFPIGTAHGSHLDKGDPEVQYRPQEIFAGLAESLAIARSMRPQKSSEVRQGGKKQRGGLGGSQPPNAPKSTLSQRLNRSVHALSNAQNRAPFLPQTTARPPGKPNAHYAAYLSSPDDFMACISAGKKSIASATKSQVVVSGASTSSGGLANSKWAPITVSNRSAPMATKSSSGLESSKWATHVISAQPAAANEATNSVSVNSWQGLETLVQVGEFESRQCESQSASSHQSIANSTSVNLSILSREGLNTNSKNQDYVVAASTSPVVQTHDAGVPRSSSFEAFGKKILFDAACAMDRRYRDEDVATAMGRGTVRIILDMKEGSSTAIVWKTEKFHFTSPITSSLKFKVMSIYAVVELPTHEGLQARWRFKFSLDWVAELFQKKLNDFIEAAPNLPASEVQGITTLPVESGSEPVDFASSAKELRVKEKVNLISFDDTDDEDGDDEQIKEQQSSYVQDLLGMVPNERFDATLDSVLMAGDMPDLIAAIRADEEEAKMDENRKVEPWNGVLIHNHPKPLMDLNGGIKSSRFASKYSRTTPIIRKHAGLDNSQILNTFPKTMSDEYSDGWTSRVRAMVNLNGGLASSKWAPKKDAATVVAKARSITGMSNRQAQDTISQDEATPKPIVTTQTDKIVQKKCQQVEDNFIQDKRITNPLRVTYSAAEIKDMRKYAYVVKRDLVSEAIAEPRSRDEVAQTIFPAIRQWANMQPQVSKNAGVRNVVDKSREATLPVPVRVVPKPPPVHQPIPSVTEHMHELRIGDTQSQGLTNGDVKNHIINSASPKQPGPAPALAQGPCISGSGDSSATLKTFKLASETIATDDFLFSRRPATTCEIKDLLKTNSGISTPRFEALPLKSSEVVAAWSTSNIVHQPTAPAASIATTILPFGGKPGANTFVPQEMYEKTPNQNKDGSESSSEDDLKRLIEEMEIHEKKKVALERAIADAKKKHEERMKADQDCKEEKDRLEKEAGKLRVQAEAAMLAKRAEETAAFKKRQEAKQQAEGKKVSVISPPIVQSGHRVPGAWFGSMSRRESFGSHRSGRSSLETIRQASPALQTQTTTPTKVPYAVSGGVAAAAHRSRLSDSSSNSFETASEGETSDDDQKKTRMGIHKGGGVSGQPAPLKLSSFANLRVDLPHGPASKLSAVTQNKIHTPRPNTDKPAVQPLLKQSGLSSSRFAPGNENKPPGYPSILRNVPNALAQEFSPRSLRGNHDAIPAGMLTPMAPRFGSVLVPDPSRPDGYRLVHGLVAQALGPNPAEINADRDATSLQQNSAMTQLAIPVMPSSISENTRPALVESATSLNQSSLQVQRQVQMRLQQSLSSRAASETSPKTVA